MGRWMIICGVASVLATGCGGGESTSVGGHRVEGTVWRLKGWSASSLDPAAYEITAECGDAEISGRSAVNTYGGPCTITGGGGFSVGELRTTRMAGSEDEMRAESIYLDLLRQARRHAVTKTTLTLKDEGGQDILIFEANEGRAPDRP